MESTEAELERLYRERYRRFRDGLATVTGSYDTAHDVVQDAFAQALVKRRAFRDEGSLEGWVWRIAFRLALKERRRGLRRASPESADPAVVDAQRDPALAAALQRLPARKRLIVFLHYFADLPYVRSFRALRSASFQSSVAGPGASASRRVRRYSSLTDG